MVRLFSQYDKNALRDILGQMLIPHLPARGGVNQIQMPPDKLIQRLPRAGGYVLLQKSLVFGHEDI